MAPSVTTGDSEFNKTEFRDGDFAASISWDDVFDVVDVGDVDKPVIESCIESIRKIIKTTQETTFKLESDRLIVDSIIKRTLGRLKGDYPDLYITTWTSKNKHEIYTCKSDVTLLMGLTFDVEDTPPYPALIRNEQGTLDLGIEISFTLSAKGKRSHEGKLWWQEMCNTPTMEILHEGSHSYDATTQGFLHETAISGTKEDIAESYYERCKRIIDYLGDHVRAAG